MEIFSERTQLRCLSQASLTGIHIYKRTLRLGNHFNSRLNNILLLIPTKPTIIIARLPATKQYADFSEITCMIQFYQRHPGTTHCKPRVLCSLSFPLPPFSQQASGLITNYEKREGKAILHLSSLQIYSPSGHSVQMNLIYSSNNRKHSQDQHTILFIQHYPRGLIMEFTNTLLAMIVKYFRLTSRDFSIHGDRSIDLKKKK